jgi:hypothetical protein
MTGSKSPQEMPSGFVEGASLRFVDSFVLTRRECEPFGRDRFTVRMPGRLLFGAVTGSMSGTVGSVAPGASLVLANLDLTTE